MYKKHETDAERLANIPKGQSYVSWKAMFHIFGKEDFKVIF